MRAPLVVVVDPRLGAVVPAAAVRTVAAASEVRLDPSLPVDVAAAFARELGAVPAGEQGAPGEQVESGESGPGEPGGAGRSGSPADGTVVLLTALGAAGGDVPVTAPPPPGAALLDAVAVMDRLRSPGGCPWDAAQTHASLLRYLVEETYELYDALADGDRVAVREELGDVLLQVLFHARVAAEDPADPFTIDDVAGELVAKLVGRHPHVFAGTEVITDAGDQELRWEELKAVEKRRASALDGVARAQPAAALAAKYVSRARRAGVPADLLAAGPGDGVGPRLFGLVAAAKVGDSDEDPEGALRASAEDLGRRVRAAEDAARADGADPARLDAASWRRYWPA